MKRYHNYSEQQDPRLLKEVGDLALSIFTFTDRSAIDKQLNSI